MAKNIFIGLDVDDKAFHGCALIKDTGEAIEFKTRPNFAGISKRLSEIKRKFPNHILRVCYEASYIGFSLCRELMEAGIDCQVTAPSSIPRVHGNQIKTDRVDAAKLAQFYAAGILSFASLPDKEVEQDRDLTRSRQFILKQLSEIRTHIQSLFRRNNRHYKAETGAASHWTKHHLKWIEKQVEESSGSFRNNLKVLLEQMTSLMKTLEKYDNAIDELATLKQYEKSVRALTCYHGIKNIFAMAMVTEIGNVNRFTHPAQLSSWMGLDIREYSSGGQQNRFGITKHGNRYLRTAFIEANQRFAKGLKMNKNLKARRSGVDPKFIEIAERCRMRLRKKGNRLLLAGKHPNKVKVACAREMVGFVWESLRTVGQ